MRAEKMCPELRAQTLGHGIEKNPGSIGGNDRVRFAHRIDSAQQVLLDLEIFHHDFNDPITFSDLVEIVRKVADGDAIGIFGVHEKCRTGCDHFIETGLDDAIAHLRVGVSAFFHVRRHNIQHQRAHTGTGKQGGNAAAHNAGPEHRC